MNPKTSENEYDDAEENDSSLDSMEVEECFDIEKDYQYWNFPGFHPHRSFSKAQIESWSSKDFEN